MKKLKALYVGQKYLYKFKQLSKILSWEIMSQTTWENIYADYLYYKPDIILLCEDLSIQEVLSKYNKYPFRYIFMQNNSIVDTSLLPVFHEPCEVISILKNEYGLTYKDIATYMKRLNLRPYGKMRASSYNERNIKYLYNNICKKVGDIVDNNEKR